MRPSEQWWTINGAAIMEALERCANGESPEIMYLELIANSEVGGDDALCRPCADGHPHRCMGGDCATERRRERFDGIGGDDEVE